VSWRLLARSQGELQDQRREFAEFRARAKQTEALGRAFQKQVEQSKEAMEELTSEMRNMREQAAADAEAARAKAAEELEEARKAAEARSAEQRASFDELRAEMEANAKRTSSKIADLTGTLGKTRETLQGVQTDLHAAVEKQGEIRRHMARDAAEDKRSIAQQLQDAKDVRATVQYLVSEAISLHRFKEAGLV
jgi:DNA repair exonuclease SbcCD ATPase subunit